MSPAMLLFATTVQAQASVFASKVETVPIDVAVTRSDAAVSGLTAADFELREDGLVQPLDFVQEQRNVPLAATLLFDLSASVQGESLEALWDYSASYEADLLHPSLLERVEQLPPESSALRARCPSLAGDALVRAWNAWTTLGTNAWISGGAKGRTECRMANADVDCTADCRLRSVD